MSIKNKHREKNEIEIMGMKLGHLVEDAERWWDRKGRHILANRSFSEEMENQQDALNATNPVHPNYLGGKSGIMLGLKWAMLRPDERYKVATIFAVTLKRMWDCGEPGHA